MAKYRKNKNRSGYDDERFEPIHKYKSDTPYERPKRPVRDVSQEEFKCGHCRTFVGPPISGGRHRNHCPLCLYSRHVDHKTPGDRKSECRSLMEPVGVRYRRNGEQVVVHRCLGCAVERNCRVAADDHPITCMQLPLLEWMNIEVAEMEEIA